MGRGNSWWTRETAGAPHWMVIVVLALAAAVVGVPLTVNLSQPVEAYSPKPRPSQTISTPHVVAFVGDSYTHGEGSTSRLLRWSSLVADDRGWVEANLGVGGSGYVNGDAYVNRLDALVLAHPDTVIVSGGRNDIWHDPETVGAAASDLIAAVRERATSAEILILNPWWDDDVAPDTLLAVADQIRAAAARAGVTYLETGQPLLGNPATVIEDGVHPSDARHRAIADAVLAALR